MKCSTFQRVFQWNSNEAQKTSNNSLKHTSNAIRCFGLTWQPLVLTTAWLPDCLKRKLKIFAFVKQLHFGGELNKIYRTIDVPD